MADLTPEEQKAAEVAGRELKKKLKKLDDAERQTGPQPVEDADTGTPGGASVER